MRVVVTGAMNPVGAAVVRELAKAGHDVRAFGVPAGENPFAGLAGISTYPGWVRLGGSIEPVASEAQAVIHCANLDAPGDDKQAHAVHIEKGTLYTRYAAERELVESFIVAFPRDASRAHGKLFDAARHVVAATRPVIGHTVVEVDATDPAGAARQIVAAVHHEEMATGKAA